nr:reverse transcriptase domain-containing protein [Tanacetum cinerariifolium]
MSAMANTTPITKTATKEKTPNGAEAASRVNILDFCEEHYEDILLVMDKICRDKQKKCIQGRSVHTSNPQFQKFTENTNAYYVKTYDRTGDLEDHVKFFQTAALVDRWAMPTWCHMFNSTRIGTARWKYTISNRRWRNLMGRFKVETGRMKGAPKCMRISRFMHGVNNPELTKRLNEHVPKTVEEMMIATTDFIREETAVASKKKVHTPWKSQDQSKRKSSEQRSDFRNQPRDGRVPEIREIQAVPSTTHGMLKFSVNGGIVTIRSTILTPTEFTTIAATPKDHAKKAEAHHENFKPSDMTGVPRSISKHRLNIQEGYSPVRFITPFQKSIRRSNPFAATPLSDSWKYTKAIIKYRWLSKMRKRRLSTPVTRFISKSAEKSLTLFNTLKKCIKKSDFQWTLDAKQAFKQLKQHLAKLPMPVAPKPKEELIMYLSASYRAISAVLMTERDIVRTPVYFILADFLIKKSDDASPEASVIETLQEPWTLFTDGSSCVDGSGTGLILTSPEGTKFTYALRFQFTASNNEAEYEVLIAYLWRATQMRVRNVHLSHGDTHFSLTYGTEAVIPIEIIMPMYCNAVVDVVHNNEELRLNLDLLKERRECAAIREAKAKLKMTKYYNTRVHGVTFRPGDSVYHSNEASQAMDGGKAWSEVGRTL